MIKSILFSAIVPESLQAVWVENLREDGGSRTKNRTRSNKTMQNDVRFRSKTFVARYVGRTSEQTNNRLYLGVSLVDGIDRQAETKAETRLDECDLALAVCVCVCACRNIVNAASTLSRR